MAALPPSGCVGCTQPCDQDCTSCGLTHLHSFSWKETYYCDDPKLKLLKTMEWTRTRAEWQGGSVLAAPLLFCSAAEGTVRMSGTPSPLAVDCCRELAALLCSSGTSRF